MTDPYDVDEQELPGMWSYADFTGEDYDPPRCEGDVATGVCNAVLRRDWTCPNAGKHLSEEPK